MLTIEAVASLGHRNRPLSGTILNPGRDAEEPEIEQVSQVLKSAISYELNPGNIEQPNDPEHSYISREGYGVAGVLAIMADTDPERFSQLETRFRTLRPETESIDIWMAGGKVVWGVRDKGQEYPFEAVHLSWGDRLLVGLLCVLYTTRPGAMIAIEEIDRGFNHSRYAEVIEVLTEAAYDGLDGRDRIQIVVTTHSPSFLNKLDDRLGERPTGYEGAGRMDGRQTIARSSQGEAGNRFAGVPARRTLGVRPARRW